MPLLRLPQRPPKDFLTDSALTLAFYYLCSLVSIRGRQVGDRLTATKLLFFVAYPWYRRGIRGYNFTFQKYTHGPFTRELYETWGDLEWSGFLEVPSGPSSISLTSEGVEVARGFVKEVLQLGANHPYLSDLLDTAVTHARKSTNQILEDCYNMQVIPEGSSQPMTMRDVRDDVILTRRLLPSKAKAEVVIPDRWLMQFDILRRVSTSQGTPYEPLARLHTPELVQEIAVNLEALDRGEGKRISKQRLLQELHFGQASP